MESIPELPGEVIVAIQQGQKIQAIKLLREAKGMGLKESKDAVDAYLQAHPELQAQQSKSGFGGLGFIVFLAAIVYLLYRLIG